MNQMGQSEERQKNFPKSGQRLNEHFCCKNSCFFHENSQNEYIGKLFP